MKNQVNKDNFHLNTVANWSRTELPIDLKLGFESLKKELVVFKNNECELTENGEILILNGENHKILDFKYGDDGLAYGCIIRNNTSSKYYYTKDGVYRVSCHWGVVASCHWFIDEVSDQNIDDWVREEMITGFCAWNDFIIKDQRVKAEKIHEAYYLHKGGYVVEIDDSINKYKSILFYLDFLRERDFRWYNWLFRNDMKYINNHYIAPRSGKIIHFIDIKNRKVISINDFISQLGY